MFQQLEQPEFHLNFVDDLDEASTYMPSPFCSEGLVGDQLDVTESSPAPNGLGRIAIPTPPPEHCHNSPDSTHSSRSHGSCISTQLSASATSDSYIKGSSLEESPVSSPSSSCAEASNSNTNGSAFINSDIIADSPEMIQRESCIRSAGGLETKSEGEEGRSTSRQQNVPKNIKLPQSKLLDYLGS